MATKLASPAFTRKVVAAMQSLYPEELADGTWDNVGLLQDNIDPVHAIGDMIIQEPPSRLLLTNDLTIRVAEEAIRKNCSVIIAYHPFIFRGFKSITLQDPQQLIILQLAQHNIAVYSPHTALDAAPGGMNDWLADMLDGHGVTTKRTTIQPIPHVPVGFGGAGFGRTVEFSHPVNLGRIVETYAEGLGGLPYVMLALPKRYGHKDEPCYVSKVAICPGSGWDILENSGADLLITGELSHHNALRATMQGKAVLTVFHSNSERRFLTKRLRPQLLATMKKEMAVEDVEILISEEDEDPFQIWHVKTMPAWAYDKK